MKIEKTNKVTDPATFQPLIRFTGTISLEEIEKLDDMNMFKAPLYNSFVLAPKYKTYRIIPITNAKLFAGSDNEFETTLYADETAFTQTTGLKVAKSPTFYYENVAYEVSTIKLKTTIDINKIDVDAIIKIVAKEIKACDFKFIYSIIIQPITNPETLEVEGGIMVRGC